MNLEEIRTSYSRGKKRDAKAKDLWAHYIARSISFYPAWLCIRLGITANQVTIAGLLVGIGGCVLLAHGYFIVGAVLVNIWGLADYVDGDIARATHTESKYGSRIDGLSYLTILGLLFMCIGIGLQGRITLLYGFLSMPAEPVMFLLLGFVASSTRVFRYAITYQAQLPIEEGKPSLPIRCGMAMIGVREPLLLICAITGTLGYFLMFYAVVNTFELGAILRKIVKK